MNESKKATQGDSGKVAMSQNKRIKDTMGRLAVGQGESGNSASPTMRRAYLGIFEQHPQLV